MGEQVIFQSGEDMRKPFEGVRLGALEEGSYASEFYFYKHINGKLKYAAFQLYEEDCTADIVEREWNKVHEAFREEEKKGGV